MPSWVGHEWQGGADLDAGRRRAVVLLATLGTLGAALVGLYALTGLWLAHDAADRWAVAVAASGAVDKAVSLWAGHAPPAATSPEGEPPDAPPEPSDPEPEPSADAGHAPGTGW